MVVGFMKTEKPLLSIIGSLILYVIVLTIIIILVKTIN